MAIINVGFFSVPGSLAKNQADVVADVTTRVNDLIRTKVEAVYYFYNVLWNSPTGMTPPTGFKCFRP